MSKGRKALLALVVCAMVTAAGLIIYTTRQVAEAEVSGNTHAARIDRAVRQCEQMLDE
jgi:hypothetical protein